MIGSGPEARPLCRCDVLGEPVTAVLDVGRRHHRREVLAAARNGQNR